MLQGPRLSGQTPLCRWANSPPWTSPRNATSPAAGSALVQTGAVVASDIGTCLTVKRDADWSGEIGQRRSRARNDNSWADVSDLVDTAPGSSGPPTARVTGRALVGGRECLSPP